VTELNIEIIMAALAEKGLSQADLAKTLDVSRESVSKWLAGAAVPRPAKQLKLALALGLSRASLLNLPADSHRPQVAFRMARAKAAANENVERAEHMGKMLEALVPYLPFDRFQMPPALKSPSSDYDYLQALARTLRKEMCVSVTAPVSIQALATLFGKLQAVIVPVLWGHRKQHENAIHIYLPRTATTWVYLNLDTRLCDLKFWLAHELGHTYTFTKLKGEEGEIFADEFAGALLFPEVVARSLYEELTASSSIRSRLSRIKVVADSLQISLVCIAKQLDRYARVNRLPLLIDEAPALYQASELSKPELASTSLFGSAEIELSALMSAATLTFSTPFFSALGAMLRETDAGAAYVQGILDCPLVDARHIVSHLA
jgi:transcriptional regulator with XRE-family HTH domain/Zn-dependent peptidase ImmA (M78 family)